MGGADLVIKFHHMSLNIGGGVASPRASRITNPTGPLRCAGMACAASTGNREEKKKNKKRGERFRGEDFARSSVGRPD